MRLSRASIINLWLLPVIFAACGGRTGTLDEEFEADPASGGSKNGRLDASGGSRPEASGGSRAEASGGSAVAAGGSRHSDPETTGGASMAAGGSNRPGPPSIGGSGGALRPVGVGGWVSSGGMGGADPVACDPGESETCDDGNDCTVDTCDASSCSHLGKPNGYACDSGDTNTSGDRCRAGVCVNRPPGIPGDVDGNGCVDQADYEVIADGYNRSIGEGGADPRADFNGDDWVSYLDYLDLYEHWLEGC